MVNAFNFSKSHVPCIGVHSFIFLKYRYEESMYVENREKNRVAPLTLIDNETFEKCPRDLDKFWALPLHTHKDSCDATFGGMYHRKMKWEKTLMKKDDPPQKGVGVRMSLSNVKLNLYVMVNFLLSRVIFGRHFSTLWAEGVAPSKWLSNYDQKCRQSSGAQLFFENFSINLLTKSDTRNLERWYP